MKNNERLLNSLHARRTRSLFIRAVTAIVALMVSAFLIWSLRDLILPAVLGVLLAYLFRPLIRSPAFKFLSYRVRVVSSLMIVVLMFLGLFFVIQRSLPDDRGKLELRVRLLYKINERYAKIMGFKKHTTEGNILHSMFGNELDPFKRSLEHMLTLNKEESQKFLDYTQQDHKDTEVAKRYLRYFNANQVSDTPERDPGSIEPETKKESTLGIALHLASIWLLMPIIFIFLLFDDRHMVRYFVSLVPNRYFELTLTIIHEVDLAIGDYLRGTSLESGLVSVAFSLGLYVIGFPLKAAILLGIFAGVMNAIPFLGPVIALVASLVYALIAEDLTPLIPGLTSESIFFAVIGVALITHFMDNLIFAPVILGNAVNLHPLVVILAIMGGSLTFGFAGLLLAIPTVVVTKVMVGTLYRGLRAYYII
jgi:predicted PurR-regulated permease PerM